MDRLANMCQHISAQIIYIDNASTDHSAEIIAKRKSTADLLLTEHTRGKGAAVLAGLRQATGTYTIIQDADLEYHPSEIPALLRAAQTNKWQAVFGSRRLHKNPTARLSYYIAGVLISKLFNVLYGAKLTDQPTCYKLIQTSLLQKLELHCTGFDLDTELCCKLARRGIEIHELPITYAPRTRAEGKKIGWRDFFITLQRLWQFRSY